MGFSQSKNLVKAVVPWEEVEAKAGESYVVGEALVMASGVVSKCGATVVPEFIAQQGLTAKAGDLLLVSRVVDTQELETVAAVAMTGVRVGDKVTLHTDGVQVTATVAGGVFLVSGIDGVDVGSGVRGYFRR